MSAVDRSAIALGVIGVILLGLGEWLRRDPAATWANTTGGDE